MADQTHQIRLYVETEHLDTGHIVPLNASQIHYLHHVMRLHEGSSLTIFNGYDGEWQAIIVALRKNAGDLKVIELLRPQITASNIHLYFAPLKQDPLRFLIEKSTELGVTYFHPVLTDRTVVRGFNREKARLIAIEAAEQCERVDIPSIADLKNLKAVLSGLGQKNPVILYVCDERRQATPLLKSLATHPHESPVVLLIGPEGGFSEGEFDYLTQLSFVQFVSLSPYVLRAETACVAALAQVVGYQQKVK